MQQNQWRHCRSKLIDPSTTLYINKCLYSISFSVLYRNIASRLIMQLFNGKMTCFITACDFFGIFHILLIIAVPGLYQLMLPSH